GRDTRDEPVRARKVVARPRRRMARQDGALERSSGEKLSPVALELKAAIPRHLLVGEQRLTCSDVTFQIVDEGPPEVHFDRRSKVATRITLRRRILVLAVR